MFLRMIFPRCQAKNQRRINSWNFFKKTTKHFSQFSISHQTVHNKNHHLSKFATGIPQHIIQNQSIQKIRKEYHMDNNYRTRWLSTIHENVPKSWSSWYHGKDLQTGRKAIVRKRRVYSKIKSRQRVLCSIFDRGCVIIIVSFIEFYLGVLCFRRFIIYCLFLHVLGMFYWALTSIAHAYIV